MTGLGSMERHWGGLWFVDAAVVLERGKDTGTGGEKK